MSTQQWNLETLASWRGRDIVSEDGEKVGQLDAVIYDETFEPIWVMTSSGPLNPRNLLAPVKAVASEPHADRLLIAYPKQYLDEQPPIEVGEGWSYGEDARRLYEYFGLEFRPDNDVRVLHRHSELPGHERVFGGGAGSP